MHAEIVEVRQKVIWKVLVEIKNALGQSDFGILESTISEIRVDG